MSTYNGKGNVGRQLDSILFQKGIDVHITVRDDGSTDGTLEELQSYVERYPMKITLHQGCNVGYKRSFLNLLDLARKAEFYAFSDQDDIWEEDKLSSAVAMLEGRSTVLYVSNLDIYAPDLKKVSSTCFSQKRSSIFSEFARHRYAGCTFVFDDKLKDKVSAFSHLDMPDRTMPSHDSLIARCAYACGSVVVDENSYIKHVRYSNSVTAGGNGLLKRFKLEWKILVSPSVTSSTASMILKNVSDIHPEYRPFLESVAEYRSSFRKWFALLTDRRLQTGIWQCDLLCKLKIFIGSY